MQNNSTSVSQIFELQQNRLPETNAKSISHRKKKLKSLIKALLDTRAEAQKAMFNDFSKSTEEVDLTELYPVVNEIKTLIKNMSEWLADEHVATPLVFTGTRSKIVHQPKGHVLVLSPWNYPINLSLIPLVSAYAAGNAVILKPSEFTPNSSDFLADLIAQVFDPSEVTVMRGSAEIASELTRLPFHHIFFTGSPQVGKLVMKSAAENLASVTLELGGKSPFIVGKSANLKLAASRLVYSKFQNAGQVCVSPDYALVHNSVKDTFVSEIKVALSHAYGDHIKTNSLYPRIVTEGHFSRLLEAMEEAKKDHAKIEIGGETDSTQNFISPTVLTNVSDTCTLMQDEIFGPVLPIKTFVTTEEAIKEINERENALAMYVFTKDSKEKELILQSTRAGALCINEGHIHFGNSNLPFGGQNNSGIGKSHGKFGIEEFINKRAVMEGNGWPYAPKLAMPPYSNFKRKIIDFLLKWG